MATEFTNSVRAFMDGVWRAAAHYLNHHRQWRFDDLRVGVIFHHLTPFDSWRVNHFAVNRPVLEEKFDLNLEEESRGNSNC